MIRLQDLKPEDVGREVRYETFGRIEYGRITSWNEANIFVLYHTVMAGDRQMRRTGSTSEATRPEDLEWAAAAGYSNILRTGDGKIVAPIKDINGFKNDID